MTNHAETTELAEQEVVVPAPTDYPLNAQNPPKSGFGEFGGFGG